MSTPLIAKLEAVIIIILLAVLFEPYLVTRSDTAKTDGMDPALMQKQFELPPGTPIPTISYTISKDMIGGYDLHVTTTNYTFTPELVNEAPIPGQGHAHLYIDGQLTLLLAPWYHIPLIAPGTHTITVSLNANDHSVVAENGKPIEATSTLIVPPVE
ncbi:MAG: hypothetical protein ACYC75_01195 [Minisyncoccota bacterium]